MKWTASKIKATKGERKLACLTAYDYATARLVDAAGIQLILVGDSLAMTMLGYENTLPVTMDQMVHHTAAVVRGVEQALVVADMPFMSYQISQAQALSNKSWHPPKISDLTAIFFSSSLLPTRL